MPRIPLAERRARLVRAAIRVVGQKGVAAATTRAIAAEAEMPLAGFHYAFASHNALMAEVIRVVMIEEATAMGQLIPGATLSEAVGQSLLGFVDSLVEDSSRQRAVLELTHYALRTPGQQHLVVEAQGMVLQRIAGMFEAFAAEAGISYTVPTSQLASMFLVMIDGITVSFVIEPDAEKLRAHVPALASSFDAFVVH